MFWHCLEANQSRRKRLLGKIIFFTGLFLVSIAVTWAANPIVTNIYTADPAALVANGVFYIYCGHDEQVAGGSGFMMKDWHILASTDMVNWTDHGAKLKYTDFSWAMGDAWAGQCVQGRDGKYYWYVPVNDRTSNGWMAIGVAVGDTPLGPFRDAKGTWLLNDQTPNSSPLNIDPTVFIDDNGQAYIYWGSYWGLRAAKLKSNMIELDGSVMTPQGATGFWEAPYLWKRNGLYYLAYAAGGNPATIDYCTGTNPLGPWTYRGRICDTVSSPTNHCAIQEYKGQWYFVYHNAGAPGGGEFRRSVCVDYLYYNADGTIQKVIQTKNGVGPVTSTPTPTPTPIPSQTSPIVWYQCNETSGATLNDASGQGRNATVSGGYFWATGRSGNALSFNGSSGYAQLPSGIVSGLNDFTIAAWVKLNTANTWSRIFDFGNNTTVNMFLTPQSGSNTLRYAITTGSNANEQQINGSASLPTGVWKHVAVTLSANLGILYVDGAEVGRNLNLTLKPAALGNTAANYLGRSQYADPYLNGLIDNFRIYNRALSATEVRNLYSSGN